MTAFSPAFSSIGDTTFADSSSIILLIRSPEGTDSMGAVSVENRAFILATLPKAFATKAFASLLDTTSIAMKDKINLKENML
mmetsp:Transcript_11739/g.11373  ORF Transcript_11739/g.11373 Transcript_11739/m.11373 type:complete len:82 (-) Transcript_11739:95-340(-)